MAILHEDPYRLTEVEGVGFARADKIALAADVPPESEPPRPGRRGLRPRRGRAAGQQLPAAGGADPARREAARPRSRPRGAGRSARPARRGGARLPRADPRQRGRGRRRRWRARAAAPPHLDHDPGETPPRTRGTELTDEQWAAVRGAFASRDLGPHRRARRRQDRLHPGDRRRGRGGQRYASPSARRPAAPRGGSRRRPATRRRRSTGCSSGCRDASPPSSPGHPLPADLVDRRRVLDAEPAPDRGAARRAWPSRPTSSSSATPTSCRRSAPASRSRT